MYNKNITYRVSVIYAKRCLLHQRTEQLAAKWVTNTDESPWICWKIFMRFFFWRLYVIEWWWVRLAPRWWDNQWRAFNEDTWEHNSWGWVQKVVVSIDVKEIVQHENATFTLNTFNMLSLTLWNWISREIRF